MINVYNWYEENAIRAYPLSETKDSFIPNSLIVDALIYSVTEQPEVSRIYLDGDFLIVDLGEGGSASYNYNSDSPFTEIPVLDRGRKKGFIVFGEGVEQARGVFVSPYTPASGLNYFVAEAVFHLKSNVTSLSDGSRQSFGDVQLVEGDAVHITRVSDGFLFSVFDDVAECGTDRTPCIKTINSVEPDARGNINLQSKDILFFTPVVDGVRLDTVLDSTTQCFERFEDGGQGPPGETGPIGPQGPKGDCVVMPERDCTCLTCEVCDTCEVGDEEACEEDDMEDCMLCDTCDFTLAFNNATEDITVVSGCLIRDHYMAYNQTEDYSRAYDPAHSHDERNFHRYWDYEANQSFGLLEMRSTYSPTPTDVHILFISNMFYQVEGEPELTELKFFVLQHRELKEWSHTYEAPFGNRTWRDFIFSKDRMYAGSDPDTPPWYPDPSLITGAPPNVLPRVDEPTLSFFLPSPSDEDLSPFFCEENGRSIVFYSTYANVGSGDLTKEVHVVFLDTGEDYVLSGYQIDDQGTYPVCTVWNVTEDRKSNEFPLILGIHDREVERLDGAPSGSFIGDVHYEQWHLHAVREEAISLRCHDVGAPEIFTVNDQFETMMTSKSPISGFSVNTLNDAEVTVYRNVQSDQWYLPACLLCDEDDVSDEFGG